MGCKLHVIWWGCFVCLSNLKSEGVIMFYKKVLFIGFVGLSISALYSCTKGESNKGTMGGESNNGTMNKTEVMAYVTNYGNNTVSSCTLGDSGTLTNCKNTGSGFSWPFGIAFNGNYAYVTNYGNNTVSSCTLGDSGTLTNCKNTGSGFSWPIGIAFKMP